MRRPRTAAARASESSVESGMVLEETRRAKVCGLQAGIAAGFRSFSVTHH